MTKSSEASRLLSEHGLTPKKWMGQNLVVNPHYLHKILEAARIEAGDTIVEIGAGLGALTQGLLDLGAKVRALEIDRGFYRLLEERFTGNPDVVLLHEDALKYDLRGLAGELGPLKVVANLPYNISSRLIFKFHEDSDVFSSLCILLQREWPNASWPCPAPRTTGFSRCSWQPVPMWKPASTSLEVPSFRFPKSLPG